MPEYSMSFRYPCPWQEGTTPCTGELERESTPMSTCMGMLGTGVDDNEHSDSFKCDTCGRLFMRSWKWKLFEG